MTSTISYIDHLILIFKYLAETIVEHGFELLDLRMFPLSP